MAFDDLQHARVKREVEKFLNRKRPPEHVRDQLDLGYAIDVDNQSVEIFEIRPDWRNPEEVMRTPAAKVRYVKSRDIWKLYWMRGDGKWHEYEPVPSVGALEKALEFVEEDANCCFWG